jgi:dephospho-CoA kinase
LNASIQAMHKALAKLIPTQSAGSSPGPMVKAIISIFGNSIFENGQLNRQQLASIVFSNPDKLKELNSIIHPEVKRLFAIC